MQRIKDYLLAGLAVAVGLLSAVAMWYRGNLKSAQLKGSEKARKTEKKAVDAMIDGLEKEEKIKNETDKPYRDYFSD